MEKSKKYEKLILQYYNDFIKNYKSNNDPLNYKIIADKESKTYILTLVGWEDKYTFTYSTLFHLEIIEDKVVLQRNITEILILEELIKRGIPKRDMWLGFNPDYANKHAGYGVEETELVEN